MTRRPGFSVHEVSGRLLHEKLLADAQDFVSALVAQTEITEAPVFPQHGYTDTGTLRAVVVAS